MHWHGVPDLTLFLFADFQINFFHNKSSNKKRISKTFENVTNLWGTLYVLGQLGVCRATCGGVQVIAYSVLMTCLNLPLNVDDFISLTVAVKERLNMI